VKKILLAMTDRDAMRLLKSRLSREEYYILMASSGERAMALFEAEQPDMVILDASLPGRDGYGVCRQIRGHSQLNGTFVILLIAFGEKLKIREGFEHVADDYILKPVNLGEMSTRIKALMRRAGRKDGLSPLTGSPGHVHVKSEIKRRIDWQETFALCAVTLDHFRAYNEVYGFEFGDRAIQQLDEILTRVKREVKPKGFYLGHMGADNFIVLLSPDDVERYCREVIVGFERLRSDLFRQSDLQRGYIVTADRTGRMRRFSLMAISIGVITSEHQSFRSGQEALDAVRWALHQAKVRGGGNCYLRRDGPLGLVEARKNEASRKILVVDEDSLSRRLLKLKLEREGYEVRTATSGQEAMKIARADPPDLIFLDDSLSKVGGRRTTSYFKKDARTATIPLVMLTADIDWKKERPIEADDYLVKPCSFKYLVRKVEEYLDHS